MSHTNTPHPEEHPGGEAVGGASRRTQGAVAAPAIAVEVTVSCGGWRQAYAEAPAVAERAARAALSDSANTRTQLVVGIVLTDDDEQRQLNHTYRGLDKPTNVLAFPMAEPASPAPQGAPVLLGDVVLALETVRREAAEQQKSLSDHLAHLVVHGSLHLLGFDHETATEAALMEAREIEILKRLGVPDPYRDTM